MGGVGIPRTHLTIALLKLPDCESEDAISSVVFLLVRATGALINTRKHTWTVQAGADWATGPPRVPALDLYQ